MQGYRYFQLEETPSGMIVRISESHLCGGCVAEVLKLELSRLVKTKSPQLLLIDFQCVRTMSSGVIGALLSIKRQLDRYGAQLKLCAVGVPIREIYRTMQLDGNVFHICDSVAEGLPKEETCGGGCNAEGKRPKASLKPLNSPHKGVCLV
jgi:anti-anti-sigma regulatory factor